jgi:hypothetical protein
MRAKNWCILFMLFLASFVSKAGTNWELKKDAEGIKVYTADKAGSNVKAIKVLCTLNASPDQLIRYLMNAKAHEQWVYSTKQSYLIKQVSEGHQIYYSEITMPWPLSNRDIVVDFKIVRNPNNVITVKASAIDGYVAKDKKKVRINFSDVNWTVTPAGANTLNIEYVAQADPGGSIPGWVSNMFITKGPFETFKLLRTALKVGANESVSSNAR